MMSVAFGSEGPVVGDMGGWGGMILDLAIEQGTRCEHLEARPVQPSHLFIAEGRWRCRSCTVRLGATGRPGLGFSQAEEGTCDRCRRNVGIGHLEPLVLRQDIWIMYGGLCGECFALMTDQEGARVWQPPRT